MPATFLAAIVLAGLAILATLLSAAARRVASRPPGDEPPSYPAAAREAWERTKKAGEAARGARKALTATAAAFGATAALLTLLASVTAVSTKQVGIVTAFGRPNGVVLSNGLHGKLPWQKVNTFDAAIQTDSYAPESTGGDREGDCITVRIASQATACVSVSARWRINPGQADELFRDYKTFGNVRASLVTRDLRAALNGVFTGYDPLATVDADDTGTPTYDELSKATADALRERVGAPIHIESVVVSHIAFDGTTQDRINALQAEVAQTRVAEQRQETSAAEAEANRILADSVSNDPNVLVAQCMTLLRAAVDKGQALPAGFSCWPGQAAPFAVTGQ